MFNTSLNSVPNGVMILDIKSQQITFVNREMEDKLGVKGSLMQEKLEEYRYHSKQIQRLSSSNGGS